MRIALISYPMLWQRRGGVQNKIRNSLRALRDKGLDAKLFDINNDKLTNYDIIHVFCTGSGNHRIVQAANAASVPVVLSSVFSLPYNRFAGIRDRALHRLIRTVSSFQLTTNYGQSAIALEGALKVIALGEKERQALIRVHKVPDEKIHIIPNGIYDDFFDASQDRFFQEYPRLKSRPFVLMSASVSAAKNQYAAAKAIKGTDLSLVLFGDTSKENRPYLEKCLAVDKTRIHYLGTRPQNDPVYISAYAAARVTAIPSLAEVTPNVALESLAAGTPVVCTTHHAFDIHFDSSCWQETVPTDITLLRQTLLRLSSAPPKAETCRNAVRHLSWTSIAEQLIDVYEEILSK